MVWVNNIDKKTFSKIIRDNYEFRFFKSSSYDSNVVSCMYDCLLNEPILIMDKDKDGLGITSFYKDDYIMLYDHICVDSIEDFIHNLKCIVNEKPHSIFLVSSIYTSLSDDCIYIRCKIIDDCRESNSPVVKKFIADRRRLKIKTLLSKSVSKAI